MIQWLKRYFDLNCGERGNNYLAEERRGGAICDFSFAEKNVVPKVYNGSGVVVRKNDLPEGKKKDDTNIKSSVAAIRSETRVLEPKSNNTNIPKVKKAEKTEKVSNNEEVAEYKNKLNDLEIKLEMITEIVKSSEEAEQKIKFIEDVLQIASTKIDEE